MMRKIGTILRRLSVTAVCLIGCAGGENPGDPAPLKVMTFNVLCSFCNADYDPWADRLQYFADIFQRHDPDLIGLQELVLAKEVEEILAVAPGYEAIYFHNEQALKDYPDAAILYRTARFEVSETGSFWLSPTPDEPWSLGFAKGGQLFRLVIWARLKQISDGRELYFVTTHFDNNSPSQDLSAPLLLERIAPLAAKHPTVVTGDFNSQTFDPAYKTLVEGVSGTGFRFINAFDIAAQWSIDTNLSPVPAYDVPGRIDHIFLAGANWRCKDWTVDLNAYGPNQRFPSDHFPIAATLEW
ncbi:MAG: endonuclease/exonuclease/phosphatase family protein [Nitrospirae bacterium]|nr:endonuclease/exonuclease/phosphatase family protein [Nitrospirota bacterium]